MAKFKPNHYPQGIFAPVFLCRQIQKGTFEYTLSKLIDDVLDLSVFEKRYKNGDTGASAYNPRTLLKVIFMAYSRGITSSRRISELCKENILFMALSANTQPHFTTIASFVSLMENEIRDLFLQVLSVCDKRGLIGKEMFAIDGCKLPSNASKEWSGTINDFHRKRQKLETAIARILEKHKAHDSSQTDEVVKNREEQYIESLRHDLDKINNFLESNEDRRGLSGKPIKSNITDNESAKMQTSKGVIQGYVGVATVDKKAQVIINAEAFGQGYEQDLLIPSIEATRANFKDIGYQGDIFNDAMLAADNGYHSEDNMEFIFQENIDAYIPDRDFRKRDPRYVGSERHKELKQNKGQGKSTRKKFTPDDFEFAEDLSFCICPAGQRMYRSGKNIKVKDYRAYKFKGAKSSCIPCELRDQCLRKPDKTECRQVAYLTGKKRNGNNRFTEKMKAKIDTEIGRAIYGLRLAIGEPPFANIRSNLKLDRFSLRGRKKVNIQWNLFCITHNLKKIHNYGIA
jgi:transposase